MESTVKYYNCQVRLGGSLLHSVPKERISGEEVRLLRHLHGGDAIIDLKEVGRAENWSRTEELHKLANSYSSEPDKGDGRKLVEKVFGTSLDDFDSWLMDKEIADEQRQEEERTLRSMNEKSNVPLPRAVAPS